MKRILLLVCLALPGIFTFGQHPVSIHMTDLLGDQSFNYLSPIEIRDSSYIKVTRLQYYLSEIKLIHDGGQVTPVTDLYFLVSPSQDSILHLGTFTFDDLEKIEFSIGVDQAHNHLDPSTYPIEHPLAPKNPSMHWGWSAGYRFIAFEGVSGSNGIDFPDTYQIHTIDDDNYKTVILPVEEVLNGDSLIIPIQADYLRLLDGVSVLGGLISHKATGASAIIMQNMQAYVFTGAQTSSTSSLASVSTVDVSPNPARDYVDISYNFPGAQHLTMVMKDFTGRTIQSLELEETTGSASLQFNLVPGMYVLTIQQRNRLLAVNKLIVE